MFGYVTYVFDHVIYMSTYVKYMFECAKCISKYRGLMLNYVNTVDRCMAIHM